MRVLPVSVCLSPHDIEDWTSKVRSAPDEELIAFRLSNYLGLRTVHDQRWKMFVEIAEEELRYRLTGK